MIPKAYLIRSSVLLRIGSLVYARCGSRVLDHAANDMPESPLSSAPGINNVRHQRDSLILVPVLPFFTASKTNVQFGSHQAAFIIQLEKLSLARYVSSTANATPTQSRRGDFTFFFLCIYS